MAENNTIKTELGRVLGPGADASTNVSGPISLMPDVIAQNTAQLVEVRNSLQNQLSSLLENTRALIDNTNKSQSTGSKVGSAATSIASSMFGGGILGPIISGLTSLFGRDDEQAAPEPLVKFALPGAVHVDAGLQRGSAGLASYQQNDTPRATPLAAASAPAPQITVNVSAMDSRSFLDHSGDIANAVKRALLESNSLGDVIGEM
jgi:hypothetical protein